MATAGVFSSVPGAGGGVALFAVKYPLIAYPSAASPRYASLPASGGMAAAVPVVGGRAILLASRARPPHSAMGTARRGEVAATAAAAGLFSFSGGIAAGSRATCSPLRFPAAAPSVLSYRARILRWASNSDGTPEHESVEGPLQPRQSIFSRFTEVGRKLVEEVKRNAFTLVLLFVALGIGNLACNRYPCSDYAIMLVNVCEKAEKFHKFVSHFVPIIKKFISCFW